MSRKPEESTSLYDLILEIDQRTLYLKRKDTQRWIVSDGKYESVSHPTEKTVKVAGVTYKIIEDANGNVSLKKLFAESLMISQGVIELRGREYEVVRNTDGTYT